MTRRTIYNSMLDWFRSMFAHKPNGVHLQRLRAIRNETIRKVTITIDGKPLSDIYPEKDEETIGLAVKFHFGILPDYSNYVTKDGSDDYPKLEDYFPDGSMVNLPVRQGDTHASVDGKPYILMSVTGEHPDHNNISTPSRDWFAWSYRFWRDEVIDEHILIPLDSSDEPNKHNGTTEEDIDSQTNFVIKETED